MATAAQRKAIERLTAEARAKGYTTGTLKGELCRVLPVKEWPTRAYHALTTPPDYELWAAQCLVGDDYEKVWYPANPTVAEAEAFMNSWEAETGQDVGESAAS